MNIKLGFSGRWVHRASGISGGNGREESEGKGRHERTVLRTFLNPTAQLSKRMVALLFVSKKAHSLVGLPFESFLLHHDMGIVTCQITLSNNYLLKYQKVTYQRVVVNSLSFRKTGLSRAYSQIIIPNLNSLKLTYNIFDDSLNGKIKTPQTY